uniref:DUF7036 domain-containing protein n=1 Tax=Oryza punctata TaxID=4537 RepID=A0A0E0KDS0_ORYPU
MGKAAGTAGDQTPGGGDGSREGMVGEGEERGRRRRWWRCVAAVLLGAAVVPSFSRRRGVAREDRWGGADVVASIKLQRMISELTENKQKLEYDIFEEIDIGNSMILRFPGAITIIPPQNAFVAQKHDALFNFSLNFPIDVVQNKLSELKAQMKSGLFISQLEILYVTLTNLDDSTVAPPTIVQTSVLLVVGADRKQPSLQRLKELAQTLKNSSSGNLGLNHTLFGKVKQISLSSYLKHSLNNAGSPVPQPYYQPHTTHQDNNHDHHSHHHHHHHSHHHHHRHHDLSHHGLQHFPPSPAPLHGIPTFVSCDSSCMRKKLHSDAKHHSTPHMDPSFRHMTPVASPNSYEASGPYVDPPSFHPRIPLSPLPTVVFHAMPPSESVGILKHPYKFSSISPAPSPTDQIVQMQSQQ